MVPYKAGRTETEMPKVSEEHLEARRQQIIDAAVQCFARSGIHGTSLDDIRLEADLSRGAVYHYFKSKEDIIDALRERSIEEDEQLLEDSLESRPDLPEWMRTLDKGIKRNVQTPGNIDTRVAMFLWAEALLNERVLNSQRELFKPWRERMPAMVKQSQEVGDINPDLDPEAIIFVVAAISIGATAQLAWDPDTHDIDAAVEVAEALFTGKFWTRPDGRPASDNSD